MPTYTPKAGDTTRTWYVIDATDVVLGRLAVAAATLLRGKHKPTFTPNVDGGDFVIVINADKVAISGDKLNNKFAYRHSGYPGGLRRRTIGEMMAEAPRPGRRERDRRHAPAQQAGPSDPEEAEGLRRARSIRTPPSSRFRTRSSRWPSDRDRRRDRDRPRSTDAEIAAPEAAEAAETVDVGRDRDRGATRPPVREPSCIDRPIQTVGRRKEAVVRVRLTPGTGKFNLDGRSLEEYFPNKVHQQLIKAPLVTRRPGRQRRHLRPPRRRRPVRPGRRAAPGDRPGADHRAARGPARR